jgi:hypothetical protein
MARHELTFEEWRRVADKDACAVWLAWWCEGDYLGLVQAALSGQTLRAHRNDDGDVERLKKALASWAVSELQREVEAGRGRSEWEEVIYVLHVDVPAVERLAASSEPLPALVEEGVVGNFNA